MEFWRREKSSRRQLEIKEKWKKKKTQTRWPLYFPFEKQDRHNVQTQTAAWYFKENGKSGHILSKSDGWTNRRTKHPFGNDWTTYRVSQKKRSFVPQSKILWPQKPHDLDAAQQDDHSSRNILWKKRNVFLGHPISVSVSIRQSYASELGRSIGYLSLIYGLFMRLIVMRGRLKNMKSGC